MPPAVLFAPASPPIGPIRGSVSLGASQATPIPRILQAPFFETRPAHHPRPRLHPDTPDPSDPTTRLPSPLRYPFQRTGASHNPALIRNPPRPHFNIIAMTSLPLFFLLLLCLAALCAADFDRDDIQDDYNLRAGDKSICADRLRLEGDELLIPANDIELDGNECSGGSIALTKDPAGGNIVVAFFKAKQDTVGSFLAGPIPARIVCGTASIEPATVAVLVRPDDELDDVKWTDIFGPHSPIGDNAKDDDWDFEEDRKYIFLGDQCFYAQTNLGDRVECFPGDALVHLDNGRSKRMDQLVIGDRVLVAHGLYSEIFAWTHHSPEAVSRSYVALSTDAGHRLVTTAGHYVYADGRPVQARHVRTGMTMRSSTGEQVSVVKVERIRAKGLYNPQTVHGDIVVNGLVSTSYTAAIDPPVSHALLAPLRAAYKAVRGTLLPAVQSVEL